MATDLSVARQVGSISKEMLGMDSIRAFGPSRMTENRSGPLGDSKLQVLSTKL